MEQFLCGTKILSGPGAVGELKTLKARRFLLVTDPFFEKNGWANRITALSGAAQTRIFSQITPDPGVELAARGTALVKEWKPDVVAALGGGSTMDCAKAMVWFSGLPIRLVAIPTTSGSGSEVTDFAVLTHGKGKHPLIDSRLRPELAILDGELLEELPGPLVADGGFDVLSHALEAYVATGSSPITDALAADAFRVVFSSLTASYKGNTRVRQRIHTAATMAGMAFSQAGLGLCHGISHALGGLFHVPHGRLNALLLPAVITCNAHKAGEKYSRLAREAGLGGSAEVLAVRNLKNGLIRLRRELDMPQTLQQAGVDPRRVQANSRELVQRVLEDPCCRTNPLPVEDFMVRRILDEVTGRV